MENHNLHVSFHISHFSLAVSAVFSMLWKWVRVDGLQSFYKKRRAFTPFKFITVKFVDNVEFCCCLCNKTRANCLHFLFSSLYFENVKFSECSCVGVWVCVCLWINIYMCVLIYYMWVYLWLYACPLMYYGVLQNSYFTFFTSHIRTARAATAY